MIYNFYLFNKHGVCIAYKEWHRKKKATMSQNEEFKLLYGMLLSLRSFSRRLADNDVKQLVQNYRTSNYRLNYMETATGLKFVLNTDPEAQGVVDLIRLIYQIYVETVVKNPFVDTAIPIQSELFHTRVDKAVETHPAFSV